MAKAKRFRKQRNARYHTVKREIEADRAVVAAFNRENVIGTRVIYTDDEGIDVVTRTSSAAQMYGDVVPVIWLDGVSGGTTLSRVRVAPLIDGTPDKCKQCGTFLGFGHPAFHLGICDDCDGANHECG